MPKKKQADARISDMKDRFLARAGELWDDHITDAMQIMEESESKRFNLTYHAAFDFSESTAKLETSIRFSQVHTDKKVDDFEDPNEPGLGTIRDEAKEESERIQREQEAKDKPAKKKGRKPKGATDGSGE